MECYLLSVLFVLSLDSIYGIEKVADPSVARPRKVVAEVENANTIKLTWQAPKSAEENCPVKRYLIRLRHEGGKRSKTWKIDGARLSLSLHDLNEDTNYAIRLMAVTCEGKGARTRWIYVQTGRLEKNENNEWEPDGSRENVVPEKPTYVRTRTFTDSVILSWQPPEGDIIVRGYKIGYSEGVPDLNWRYVDASKRNITIENLKAGSQYVVSLCALNDAGEGPVEYELIYTREMNGPTVNPLSPPENVRAKILSATTAWLQWHDPSLGRTQQFTDERYYNVHYQAVPNGKQLSMIVKALHVVLYDLTPGTTYSFKVRTVKDSHASPFSESVRNQTFETAPGSAPRSLSVLSTNDSSTVHLSWRPPRQPNGYITAYLVLYTTDLKQPLSTWDVFAVGGPNTQVVMSTLKPNTTYYFKVQARNKQGHGPTSNTLVYHTSVFKESKSNEIYYEQEEDGAINDDDEFYTEYPQGGKYEKQVQTTKEIAMKDGTTNVGNDDNSKSLRTASLKQNTLAFKKAHDPNNHNYYVGSSHTASSPLDVSFQSVVKHTVSAVITWKLPCYESAKSPVKYMVRYYPIKNPEISTDKSTPTNFVLLDNLRPNMLYKYKIKRMTEENDDSDWSKEGLLNTNYPNSET